MFSCCAKFLLARLCKETPSLVQDCIPGLAFVGGDSWAAAMVSKYTLLYMCYPQDFCHCRQMKGWNRAGWTEQGDATALVRRADASPGVCRESSEYSCGHWVGPGKVAQCPVL